MFQNNKFSNNDKIKDKNLEDYSFEDKIEVENNFFNISINKYLDSVEFAFEKGNFTSKRLNAFFGNIPELTPKIMIQLTCIFLFLACIIFLSSCQTTDQYGNRVGQSQLPRPLPLPMLSKQTLSNNQMGEKGQEQLYIKRDQLSIKERESGSSSGSIWADSPLPKNLVTEYKPARAGDVVTINIPESLQFKPDAAPATPPAAGAPATPPANQEPIKSVKFEVVGIEPGGDVFLRGVKNYTSENGEQHNIVVVAKVPRRSINNSEINAKDLTQVAVNESLNGNISDYSSTGWDSLVSKKLSGYTPDTTKQTAELEGQKKELDTQKKSLADQQKALTEQAERLKKDRKRLDSETAKAKSLLDAATVIGDENQAGAAPAGGTQGNKQAAPATAAANKPGAANP